MLKPPLISVVMPAYNSSAYIRETIDSILNQSEQNFELIIVNDGSSDNTESIVQSYTSDKIRYYANSKNIGISGTYNKAFEIARGEYIAIAEHDDISHPRRLEIQAKFLSDNSDVGVVSAIRKNFIGHPPPLKNLQINEAKVKYNPAQVRGKFVFNIFNAAVRNGVAMIRKSILVQHKIVYDVDLQRAMDIDFYQRLNFVTDMVVLDSELLGYRIHADNHSKASHLTRPYILQITKEFWKNNFKVDISGIFDESFKLKNIEEFIQLNSIVEKIVKRKINDPKYDAQMLRTGAVDFLYRNLHDLVRQTNNNCSFHSFHTVYKKSKLLRQINTRRKIRLYRKALFPIFLNKTRV